MSNEHVWPRWVRRLLPAKIAEEKHVYTFSSTEEGPFRQFEIPLFELTVKDVCAPCNNGWMDGLEREMQQILPGMLTGRGRVLHRNAQTKIAAWATMKALVFQRLFPARKAATPEHYAAVYALRSNQRPPTPLLTVFTARVGWSDGLADGGYYHTTTVVLSRRGETGINDEIDGYLTTIGVLDLLVQVFWQFTTEGRLSHPAPLADSFRCIWPNPQPFTWPPTRGLTRKGVEVASLQVPPLQRVSRR